MLFRSQASTQLRIEHEEREKHEREEQRREQRASDERERLVQEVRDKQERLEQATCKAEARRSELWERYGDDEIVENILGQKIWVGMTEDQLSDSMGTPKDTSTKESTRSKIEVWKYDQTRVNSYALKITLKDGIVEQFVDNR